MHTFELLLILIAACVALAYAADRLKLPLAVALVVGGIALAFMPGIGTVELEPELVLALFLPPLLQASAYQTDWPAFRSNLRPILLLAVGAVFFSAVTVALVTKALIPTLSWWAALALGAIVAPPDAVAAAAVLRQVRLPKRIVTVLEGESLINDASSLVLYRLAVAAALAGTFSLTEGVLQFFAAAVGGALAGWIVGRVAMWVFAQISDTLLDITVSLLAGFIAYFAAEWLHVSGVLAAVACGLVLGRQQHVEFTAQSRIAMTNVWEFIVFLMTALVFILIGLQMRAIMTRLAGYDLNELVLLGLAVSLTLIISRFAWVYLTVLIPRLLSPSLRRQDRAPPWTHSFVLSWAGMRGVVSLAAALALPAQFPARDIIVFIAFTVIFSTLVLQGTSLGWVIRELRLHEEEAVAAPTVAVEVRAELAAASFEAVQEHAQVAGRDVTSAENELIEEYRARAERVSMAGREDDSAARRLDAERRLRLVAIDAARGKLMDRDEEIDGEAHRALFEELDLEEEQIRRSLGEDS